MEITEEYRKLKKKWNDQAMSGEVRDEDNPLFIFSLTRTKLLQQIASGKLDVIQITLLELEARKPQLKRYSIYDRYGKKIKCTIPD